MPPSGPVPADCRGQDPSGTAGETPLEFAGVLVGTDRAEAGQGDVPPAGLDADRAGGEPRRRRALVPGLETREPDHGALALAGPRVVPAAPRPRPRVRAGVAG